MPWYRRNSADHPTNPLDWVTIANLYRKNSDGNWIKIRRAYRKNSATGSPPNEWIIVHDSDSLTPYVITAPTLESNAYLPDVFEDGSTITLTRGTWANTGSSYAPISYSLKIQYSTDNVNWTDAVTGTGTTLSYTISISDVRSPSYYFRGRVTATNVNGSSTYNTAAVLSNMDFSVTSIIAYTSGGQIFSNWTFNKTNNSSNVSSQTFKIYNNFAYTYNSQYFPSGSAVYTTSVPVGTNLVAVPTTGTNIKPGESFYAYIEAVANDTAGTIASDFSTDFISPFSGTVTITPSFAESGGFRRVESGSTVSAVVDGLPSGTTFTYEWYRSRSFSLQDDIFLGSGQSVVLLTSPSVTGERIWVNVYPTYNGQSLDILTSNQHRIIPAPPSFTLGGGGSSITITSLTATGGEFYFGTYSGPTSGTIPETAIGIDYTIPDLSTGTYTITLFSRATNGSGFSLVTTESNTGTSQSKSIVALNPPTSVSASFSSGTFYIYHSGGSGPYYQVWYNTSTSPGVNNPTTLGVTGYDFSGSSSPIVWTPSAVSSGTTYNFWVRSSNSLTTTTAGEYSAWSTVYGQATPPVATAPTSVTASNNGSTNTITVSWSGATNANYYRIYWNANGIVPGSATTYYDEEKSGATTSWAWGPGDPDRNGLLPQQGSSYYFMVAASYDNITWSSYTVTSTATSLYSPPPTGGSISLSGSGAANTSITASQSGWSNSPTSYYTEIRASTTSPVTQSSILKASANSSSVSYTITSSDAAAPAYYFRAFGYASNAGGQSSTISSNEILSFQLTVPGVPTNISCSSLLSSTNLNWNASWSPPSNNGGSAITGYDVYVQRATSSSGPWVAATTQIPAGSGAYTSTSPYSTTSTSVSGRITGSSTYTWVRVFVRAKNSVGAGSYGNAVG
jgi:hypothetical protein